MSWLRIEGRFPQHRKVAPLSDRAFRLHVTAKAWCVEEESDGEVPKDIPALLTAAPRGKSLTDTIKELLGSGLWERFGDGYRIHDFLVYNPSRAQQTAAREATKRRVERHRNSVTPPPPRNGAGNGVTPPLVTGAPIPIPSGSDQPDTTTQRPDSSERAATGPTVVAVEPVAERARKVLENPYDGQYSRPSTWPEVQRVAEAWAFGMRLKLRDTVTNDSDLRTILEALRDGYSVEELELAGARAKTSEHFGKLRRKAPAAFTAAVLRTLLAGEPKPGHFEDTGAYERFMAEGAK